MYREAPVYNQDELAFNQNEIGALVAYLHSLQ